MRDDELFRNMFVKMSGIISEETISRLDKIANETNIGARDGMVNDGEKDATTRVVTVVDMSEIKNHSEDTAWFDQAVFDAVTVALDRYTAKYPLFNIRSDCGYVVLKYTEGGHYIFHSDYSPMHPRVLTCLIYLNDDYEGGEFQMFEDGKPERIEKGTAVMFPSSEYFRHKVHPVTKGERRVVMTWLEA